MGHVFNDGPNALMGYNFVTNCMGLEIEGSTAKAKREIDGGIESISCELPLVIGAQKGLVEEKDLIIPNMRGIMQARQKSLTVLPPVDSQIKSTISKFEKPAPRGAVKMVDSDQIDRLIDLLHKEAKVI